MVRKARNERGLTQEELAELVGRSQEWVGKVESGEIAAPRDDALRRLADVLYLPLPDMYIALRQARTQEDANRIVEAIPSPDEDDPTLSVLMAGARQLTPTGRRMLVEHLRVIERLQREFEEEAARDALGGGGGGRRPD